MAVRLPRLATAPVRSEKLRADLGNPCTLLIHCQRRSGPSFSFFRFRTRSQKRQQLPGGILFGSFLRRTLRPSYKLGVLLIFALQSGLDGERFAMFRTRLF